MRKRFDVWRFWFATIPAAGFNLHAASVTLLVNRRKSSQAQQRQFTIGVRLPRWRA